MARPAVRPDSPSYLRERWNAASGPWLLPELSKVSRHHSCPDVSGATVAHSPHSHVAQRWQHPLTSVTRRQAAAAQHVVTASVALRLPLYGCVRLASGRLHGLPTQAARLPGASPGSTCVASKPTHLGTTQQANTSGLIQESLHDSSDHGDTSRQGRTRLRGCHILPIATQFATRPDSSSSAGCFLQNGVSLRPSYGAP